MKILLKIHKKISLWLLKFYFWALEWIKEDIKKEIKNFEKYHWKFKKSLID